MTKIEYAPLTDEEKQTILARHKYFVDRMNNSLPEEMRLSYDADLPKKLDDPSFYAIYRIGQQMQQQKQQQEKIHAELEKAFGKSRHEPDPLSRAIKFEFDTSGTPSAKEYNEKLYRDYLDDPYKVIKMRYGKAMNTDPTAIYKCNDDPLKLAEYYRDTYPLCEEAFIFKPVLETGDALTPEMKSAMKSMVQPMETISYPTNLVRAAESLDYLACPKLTAEQSALVQGMDLAFLREEGDRMKRILDEPLVQATSSSPTTFFERFKQRGIPLEEGMFVKYRPVTYEVDPQGNHINQKEIKYSEFFDSDPEDKVEIVPREEKQVYGMKLMNKSFAAKYQQAYQAKFNQKRGFIGEFSLAQIENRYKGNFMERYILHSTSTQYTEFLEAFKDYHNPESPNYLNKENLATKGNAYIQHKVDQGYSIETLKGTSKDRVDFVMNAITTAYELDPDEVERSVYQDYASIPRREPFLSAEAVLEDTKMERSKSMGEPVKENEIEVEEDLNMTI